jgi:hypothetical protein
MELIPVISSNIKAIGYENKTLYIEFFYNHSLYVYFNVQENIYDQLMSTNSKGQFFENFIKNVYSYKKLS